MEKMVLDKEIVVLLPEQLLFLFSCKEDKNNCH